MTAIETLYRQSVQRELESTYKIFESELSKINTEQTGQVKRLIEGKTQDIEEMELKLRNNMDMISARLVELKGFRGEVQTGFKTAERQLMVEREARLDKYKKHVQEKLEKKYQKLTQILNN
jgi:hypothetical protein